MSSKAYNALKWTALVLLPGLAALYFSLGQIWDFPKIEEIVGSITVLETFIGLILGKSAINYGSAKPIGEAIVQQAADGTAEQLRFVVDGSVSPAILNDKKVALFHVKREQSSG